MKLLQKRQTGRIRLTPINGVHVARSFDQFLDHLHFTLAEPRLLERHVDGLEFGQPLRKVRNDLDAGSVWRRTADRILLFRGLGLSRSCNDKDKKNYANFFHGGAELYQRDRFWPTDGSC